ncbi:hypothetical protein BB560_000007 [Smittium megazygosporum]|uniref:Uncharacterized protein n=1 Tax=Smittium megazygosporum TaxID=133381 RepID=A0A2T9ZLS8_9FUNG|nr:hypothetical protein BB560_000007 [Smittium megazygosporum]
MGGGNEKAFPKQEDFDLRLEESQTRSKYGFSWVVETSSLVDIFSYLEVPAANSSLVRPNASKSSKLSYEEKRNATVLGLNLNLFSWDMSKMKVIN